MKSTSVINTHKRFLPFSFQTIPNKNTNHFLNNIKNNILNHFRKSRKNNMKKGMIFDMISWCELKFCSVCSISVSGDYEKRNIKKSTFLKRFENIGSF